MSEHLLCHVALMHFQGSWYSFNQAILPLGNTSAAGVLGQELWQHSCDCTMRIRRRSLQLARLQVQTHKADNPCLGPPIRCRCKDMWPEWG